MPIAPYDSDRYRKWNRERMRRYREKIVTPSGATYGAVENYRRYRRDLQQRIESKRRRIAQIEASLPELVRKMLR
jgi:hypothetical protein